MMGLTNFQILLGIVVIVSLIILVLVCIFIGDTKVTIFFLTLATSVILLFIGGMDSLKSNINNSSDSRAEKTETDMTMIPVGMGGMMCIPSTHPRRVPSSEIRSEIQSYLDSTDSYKREGKEDEINVIKDTIKMNNSSLNFSLDKKKNETSVVYIVRFEETGLEDLVCVRNLK